MFMGLSTAAVSSTASFVSAGCLLQVGCPLALEPDGSGADGGAPACAAARGGAHELAAPHADGGASAGGKAGPVGGRAIRVPRPRPPSLRHTAAALACPR